MEHHGLRKYRGPGTWAHARAAYVAGESGPSVARRFDVGLPNLRKKAQREGWTRAAIAAEIDLKPLRGAADGPPPPRRPNPCAPDSRGLEPGTQDAPPPPFAFDPDCPDPDRASPRQALEATVRRAARALAHGRTREGLDTLKAAEALAAITGAPVPTLEAMDDGDRTAAELLEAMGIVTEYLARDLVERLFTAGSDLPPGFEHFHLRWRQRQWRDPAPAAADRARVLASGRADLFALYDEAGVVRPLPDPDPAVLDTAYALLRGRSLVEEFGGIREAMAGLVAAVRAEGGGEA